MPPADDDRLTQDNAEPQPPTEPPDGGPRVPLTDWLARHIGLATLLVLPLWLLAFNGQWRVGADSASYRIVGRSLAEVGTYSYGLLPEAHVFPGLPVLLAGLQLLFGEGALAPVLLVNATALGALLITYRLIRMRFEPWIAAAVTFGVALNSEVILHAQEIATDVPFLLGVVTAWWGWEKVERPKAQHGSLWSGSLLLMLGLALAASMRPTFWVLAVGWAVVSTYRLVRGPNRLHHGVMVGLIVVVGVTFVAIDPRFSGMNLFKGVYESRAVEAMGELDGGLLGTVFYVLGRKLTEGFFGEPMSPLGLVWATPLLYGLWLATRRAPLWGITAWVLIGTTIVLSAEPRYYIMILPVLWLGWVLYAQQVYRWTAAWMGRERGPQGDGQGWRSKLPADFAGWAMTFTLVCVPLLNTPAIINLIAEQRHPDFDTAYGDGRYAKLRPVAEALTAHTEPDQIILGPEGRVLSYWSRRTVIGDDQLFRVGGVNHAMSMFRTVEPDWGVFPAITHRHTDPDTYRLLDNRDRTAAIVAVDPVIPLGVNVDGVEWYLARPMEREGD
ncbi:MAG: hypothetical protein AAF743_04085 [Planctomycetota bacterium]